MKRKSLRFLFVGIFIALGLFAAGCGNLWKDSSGGESLSFDVTETEDGCRLANLRNFSETTLEIPGFYRGKKVVEIGCLGGETPVDEAENYHAQIEKIILPKSVKRIADYAFYGMSSLACVDIPDDAAWEGIGDKAFAKCSALRDFILPAAVKRIGTEAFSGCSRLTGFTLGTAVEQIGENIFSNCDKLTAIDVDPENLYYSGENGVLFDKDKSRLLEYPYGKTSTNYTVPFGVKEIGSRAFYGNRTLRTINLNRVTMVRKYAFARCARLAAIEGNHVKFAEIGTVEETPWLNNRTEETVMLGGALLEYRGSDETVNLEGVISISPFAFSDNKKLKTLTADNMLNSIAECAFYKCENLNAVYLYNNNRMIFIGTNVFGRNAAGRKIYVPANLYEEYTKNDFWKPYSPSLTVHRTRIRFKTNGESACADGSVEYTGYMGELPAPAKEGYKFSGWYDNPAFTGKKVEQGRLWTSMEEEITLYAQYKEKPISVYPINYYPNGGTIDAGAVRSYTAEDEVVLPKAERPGYIFEGWYYDAAFTRPAGTGWKAGETGVKYLYAKWRIAAA